MLRCASPHHFWKLVVPIFLLSTLSVLILSGGEATRPIPIQAQRHGFHQANRQSPANQAFLESYGKLPLSFEANLGQMDPSVKLLSRGSGYNLLLRGDEAVLTLRNANDAAQKSKGRRSNVNVSLGKRSRCFFCPSTFALHRRHCAGSERLRRL